MPAGDGGPLVMDVLICCYRSHLERVKPLVQSGAIVVGGMLLFPLSVVLSVHLACCLPTLSEIGSPLLSGLFFSSPDVVIQSWVYSDVLSIGAMLESHPAEGETPTFKGSMMMAVAENEAEVRSLLEKDIYGTSGVWDLEKAQIIPVSVLSLCYTLSDGLC